MVEIQNDMATLENSFAVFYKGWSLPYEAAILSLSFHPKNANLCLHKNTCKRFL